MPRAVERQLVPWKEKRRSPEDRGVDRIQGGRCGLKTGWTECECGGWEMRGSGGIGKESRAYGKGWQADLAHSPATPCGLVAKVIQATSRAIMSSHTALCPAGQ
jgi:hypothetical protein